MSGTFDHSAPADAETVIDDAYEVILETTSRSTWMPTTKWGVATVTGIGALLTAWVQAGEWNDTLTITAIGFAVQRIVAYISPNTGGTL